MAYSLGVGSLRHVSSEGNRAGEEACRLGKTWVALGYLFGIDPLTHSLVGASSLVRVALTVALIAPLAFCLGGFMPTGLRLVSGLTEHKAEYVAWGWAVNCLFSVLGSVLTTVLAISIGFNAVFVLALGVYALGVLALGALSR